MEEIKVGDTVKIVFYDTKMVVNKLNNDDTVECFWYNRGTNSICMMSFAKSLLTPISHDEFKK